MTLHDRVRETARLLKAWTGETNADLAAAWHCSEPLVRRKLNGGTGGGATISLADLEKWASHWELTPAELISGFGFLESNHRLPERIRRAKRAGQASI
jgi:hypothetical protein